MKYCSNCGKKIKEGADICLNCGKLLNQSAITQQVREIVPGRGKGIASLVLGIIASFWTLSMLAGLSNGVETLVVENYYQESAVYVISYYIGYTLLALAPGIVGLILGLKSHQEQKNGLALAGIIMAGIALAACVFVFIRFVIALL